jgi:hypothetical protein
MAITYNGTRLTSVGYNGVDLDSVWVCDIATASCTLVFSKDRCFHFMPDGDEAQWDNIETCGCKIDTGHDLDSGIAFHTSYYYVGINAQDDWSAEAAPNFPTPQNFCGILTTNATSSDIRTPPADSSGNINISLCCCYFDNERGEWCACRLGRVNIPRDKYIACTEIVTDILPFDIGRSAYNCAVLPANWDGCYFFTNLPDAYRGCARAEWPAVVVRFNLDALKGRVWCRYDSKDDKWIIGGTVGPDIISNTRNLSVGNGDCFLAVRGEYTEIPVECVCFKLESENFTTGFKPIRGWTHLKDTCLYNK